jgi:hypothetical protein
VKGHGVHAGCNTAIKRADGWCLWCLITGSSMRVMPECMVRRLESAGCRLVASRCGSEMKLVLQYSRCLNFRNKAISESRYSPLGR